MKKPVTSIEFFGCLSTVKYILNENWLRDSHSNLKLQGKILFLILSINTSVTNFLTFLILANSLLYINNFAIFKYSLNFPYLDKLVDVKNLLGNLKRHYQYPIIVFKYLIYSYYLLLLLKNYFYLTK